MGDPRYPDKLPPPPNPKRLQALYLAMVEEGVRQRARENDPEAMKQHNEKIRRQMTP